MKRTFFLLASLFLAATVPAQTPPPPLISPEVHSDNRVTSASAVPTTKKLPSSSRALPSPCPLRKDDDGVLERDHRALAPDFLWLHDHRRWRGHVRSFQSRRKANFLGRSSVVHVPDPPLFLGNRQRAAWRDSSSFLRVRRRWGRSRFLCLHFRPATTPAGSKTYPVLYLLHGFSATTRAAWTVVGPCQRDPG